MPTFSSRGTAPIVSYPSDVLGVQLHVPRGPACQLPPLSLPRHTYAAALSPSASAPLPTPVLQSTLLLANHRPPLCAHSSMSALLPALRTSFGYFSTAFRGCRVGNLNKNYRALIKKCCHGADSNMTSSRNFFTCQSSILKYPWTTLLRLKEMEYLC